MPPPSPEVAWLPEMVVSVILRVIVPGYFAGKMSIAPPSAAVLPEITALLRSSGAYGPASAIAPPLPAGALFPEIEPPEIVRGATAVRIPPPLPLLVSLPDTSVSVSVKRVLPPIPPPPEVAWLPEILLSEMLRPFGPL